jgi:hypothetical protein
MVTYSLSKVCLAVCLAIVAVSGATIGKVSYVEGEVVIVENGKEKQLKVNQKIDLGDQIRTGIESVLEVTYTKGTVIRVGEKSKVTLSGSDVANNVKVGEGRVWANVQKLASGQFRVTTPVATAAVRGTVFRVESGDDSSSTIALYEGKVDVGPADTTKIKPQAAPSGWGPPVEVAGPYEVTMETWIKLDPGSEINVRWGGKFATREINKDEDAANRWIAFNVKRDQELGIAR